MTGDYVRASSFSVAVVDRKSIGYDNVWICRLICAVAFANTLTISVLQTKTDTFANSVDPDKTAHNVSSEATLFASLFLIYNCTVLEVMDMSKRRVGTVYFRNPGLKELRTLLRDQAILRLGI